MTSAILFMAIVPLALLLVLALVLLSGRMSPRLRNIVAGCGLVVAVIGLGWSLFASAARGDWFRFAFFLIVLVWLGWRMARVYREQSARLARGAQ